ncbi:pineapple eye protein [Drosophila gunungcola]|uniref:pineapple eye protein n=1 Tax=Drosophila gunungcola TaxID=103775 RepID=UPI0022E570DC|nr:pineapple eye protein [Drosophila gunungcola]
MTMCVLCRSSENEELAFGPVLSEGRITVHRNCLYLSSNLVQRGNQRHGILRFLEEDILAEAKRCRPLTCCYCHRAGANIGCCKNGCRRTFHTKCGISNLAQNQFRDTFKSYCHQHVRRNRQRPPSEAENCIICQELLVAEGGRFSVVTCLTSPCCRNGWFHRNCLQEYANTAGYFFKCPLCNNSKEFHDVALMGISVSNQDASWETEPNAFAEQLLRDQACTAVFCRQAAGRLGDVGSLLYCNLCGSNPVHCYCTNPVDGDYVCGVCSVVSPVVSPVTRPPTPAVVTADEDNTDSDDFELIAQFPQLRAIVSRSQLSGGNDDSAMNNTRDPVHSKLSASVWDDSDTEDDEDVFRRVVEIEEQSRATGRANEEPSTSGASETPVQPLAGIGLANVVVSASPRSVPSPPGTSAATALGRRTSSTLATASSGSEKVSPPRPRAGRRSSSTLATASSGSEKVSPPRPRAGRRSAARSTATSGAEPRRSSARLQALENQENAKPEKEASPAGCSSSNAAAPTRRSLRSRRTLPARMPEPGQKESDTSKEREPKKRRVSPAPAARPTGRRPLRPLTPEATASRSNGRTLRRRTVAAPNSSQPQLGNLDVSCVANRTRQRLPAHLASRK